jgi:mono/diheme cytochrome c family protein
MMPRAGIECAPESMEKVLARLLRSFAALIPSAFLVLALGGCAVKHPVADVVQGKELFVQKCGACHTLSHAATTGDIGPNLDDAFRQDRADGIKSPAIEGLVDFWIRYPDTEGVMPAMLYKGQDAEDVAAYVSAVAARPGQDTGALADVGAVTGTTAADGKVVFTGIGGCSSCHTLAAAGATGTVGPNLDQRLRTDCQTADSLRIRGATLDKCIFTAITKPYAYISSGYAAGVMPSDFGQRLTKNEVTALVNFLATAAK